MCHIGPVRQRLKVVKIEGMPSSTDYAAVEGSIEVALVRNKNAGQAIVSTTVEL